MCPTDPKRRDRGAHTARILVSVLVLFSLSVILYHHVFGAGASRLSDHSTPVMQNPVGTTLQESQPVGTTAPLPTETLRPIALVEPIPVSDPGASVGAMERWPATSSVEILHDADLDAYIGRALNGTTLDGITVVLDPGHGGIDSGCGWPVGIRDQSVMEKNVVLSVALAAKDALESRGATVLMTRSEDTFQSIFQRPASVAEHMLDAYEAEAMDAVLDANPLDDLRALLAPILEANQDTEPGEMGRSGTSLPLKYIMDIQRQFPDWLFVSIHCNASGDYPEAHGLQAFYTSSATIWNNERSAAPGYPLSERDPSYQNYDDYGRERLAGLLAEQIVSEVPGLDRQQSDVLIDQDFAVLREQNLASVLLELGFLTNDGDRQLLADPGIQSRIGTAVSDAICTYYTTR